MNKRRVLVVGSARESHGGVSSSIRLIEGMPVWTEYSCRWIGTQIQRSYIWKLWYAVKSCFTAFFILWRYDIIHFHTVPDRICLIVQLPIFLLSILWRKRIIMHIHMGNQLVHHKDNRLFLWHLRHADFIILLARRWEELFHKEYPSIKTPTAFLYNSCQHMVSRYNPQAKNIIMLGYMDSNKAPDVLLKAWKDIGNLFPDWHVLMMGNGEVERFRRMSEDMQLQEQVHFTGYITGDEKERLLSSAAIHVLCSYEEGFPMVILESWSRGIPVITTPVGGLPDVIEEGKNCITFPFGDSEALAKQIIRLINDTTLRIQMSIYEQEFVMKHFSPATINEKLRSIYERL